MQYINDMSYTYTNLIDSLNIVHTAEFVLVQRVSCHLSGVIFVLLTKQRKVVLGVSIAVLGSYPSADPTLTPVFNITVSVHHIRRQIHKPFHVVLVNQDLEDSVQAAASAATFDICR